MEEIGTTKDVRDAVSAELKFDPLVDDADIHVVNVSGDVALNGTVPSYPQYLEAAAAAQRVGGVKNVHNHLQVVLSDADVRDDAMLTTAANNALTQNVIVPDGVEAAVEDGNVTLTGTVGYGPERAAAERAVSGLIGLRNVRNDIEISSDGVLFVALAAGIFGVLPRLGGLTHEAAGLRHARLAFLVAAVVAQAVSLGCYTLLYRQVLAAPGARLGVLLSGGT